MKYMTFNGRLGRGGYIAAIFVVSIISAVIFVALWFFEILDEESARRVMYLTAALLMICPAVQRLHDTDHSGSGLLIALIPIINLGLGLYLLLKPGTPGPNLYGDPLNVHVPSKDMREPGGYRDQTDSVHNKLRVEVVDVVSNAGGTIVRNSITCTKCGVENPVGIIFCTECGASLFKKCPECERERPAREKFCGLCGTDIVGFDRALKTLGKMQLYAEAKKWMQVQACVVQGETVKLPGEKGSAVSKNIQRLAMKAGENIKYVEDRLKKIKTKINHGSFSDALEYIADIEALDPFNLEAETLYNEALKRRRDSEILGDVERLKLLANENPSDAVILAAQILGQINEFSDTQTAEKIRETVSAIKSTSQNEVARRRAKICRVFLWGLLSVLALAAGSVGILRIAPIIQEYLFEKHVTSLVRRANEGDILAASQLCDEGFWSEMKNVNPERLSRWSESDQKIATRTARQVYALVLANWASRNKSIEERNPDFLEARAILILDGLGDPVVLSESFFIQDELGVKRDMAEDASRLIKMFEMQRPLSGGNLRMAAWKFHYAETLRQQKPEQMNRCLDLYENASHLWGKAGDRLRQGEALFWQAYCLRPDNNPNGDWGRALKLYENASRLMDSEKSRAEQGASLYWQAYCQNPDNNPNGNWSLAAELYGKAAQAQGKSGNIKMKARSLYWQAVCLEPNNNPNGDWDRAAALYGESAKIFAEMDEKTRQNYSLYGQAFCLQPNNNPNGDWDRAAAVYAESVKILGEIGDREAQGIRLAQQAFCLSPDNNPNGDWGRAVALYGESAQLLGEVVNKQGQGSSLFWQAFCLQPNNNPNGDWDQALELYALSARLYGEAGDKKAQAGSLQRKAFCSRPDKNLNGNWSRAASFYAEASQLYGEAGDKQSQAGSLFSQGLCSRPDKSSSGDWARAATLYKASARIYSEVGDMRGQEASLKWYHFCDYKAKEGVSK